jgi:glycosyltransferase involved in cell wall biosynthesis
MQPRVAGPRDRLPLARLVQPPIVARPRILAFAYDLEPDRGSEPGAGWAFVRILAGFADVTVITRRQPPSADGSFDSWTARMPEAGWIHFRSLPLRGDSARSPDGLNEPWWSRQPHLGYLLWQVKAGREARRLHAATPFDLTWHLTWANGWFGSTLSGVAAPFVLGPIGSGVSPPWRLVPGLGRRGVVFELLRGLVRTAARGLNPLARQSWRRARLILVQNRETLDWLPAQARPRVRIFHNATVVHTPERTRRRPAGEPPVAVFAGRLVPWKGCHLALKAIAGLPGWRLIICGDGPQEAHLRMLAERLGIADRVQFAGWQERDDVLRVMADDADVLLFPSLHDEAGLAVAEAAAIGLPIVCLDRGGPPVIAGGGVEPGSEKETVERLQGALKAALDSNPPLARLDPATRRIELLEVLREARLLNHETEDGSTGAPGGIPSITGPTPTGTSAPEGPP